MLNIAVLPGDGIGPEIISEAIKVLKAISEKRNIDFNFNYIKKNISNTQKKIIIFLFLKLLYLQMDQFDL